MKLWGLNHQKDGLNHWWMWLDTPHNSNVNEKTQLWSTIGAPQFLDQSRVHFVFGEFQRRSQGVVEHAQIFKAHLGDHPFNILSRVMRKTFIKQGTNSQITKKDMFIWLVVIFHILGMSSSQLTNSYFSEGYIGIPPTRHVSIFFPLPPGVHPVPAISGSTTSPSSPWPPSSWIRWSL